MTPSPETPSRVVATERPGVVHSAFEDSRDSRDAAQPNFNSKNEKGGEEPLSHLEDKRRTAAIMRRLDVRILPVAALLYFFSFVDRTAIGNSKVAGMNKDLGLTEGQYKLALSCFFITYALFEVPSNLCLRRFGARNWLPLAALPWGLMMILTGTSQDYRGLITCRVLLGVFEADIAPGLALMLSLVYPQWALQMRIALFFAAASLGGAFGGLLAYGLSEIQIAGFDGWRWIFIIEGILTMLSAIPAYYFLCNSLDDAKGISEDDKSYMKERILHDGSHNGVFETEFKVKYIWDAFKDFKLYILACIFGLTAVPAVTFALTLPVLLNTSFGYDHVKSQLMTVPVYLLAVVAVIVFAYLSDRQQSRILYYVIAMTIALIGCLISFKSDNPKVRYAASFLAVPGVFAAPPCHIALGSQNLAHKTKRGTGLAILLTFSAIVPTTSSALFPTNEAPRYPTGHKVCISCSVLGIACAIAYGYVLKWENDKKRRMRESGEAEKLTKEDLIDLGDKSPYFVYRF